jgi:hypothetical protein
LHLAPFLEFGVFDVYKVVENCAFVGELDGLPLVFPPVAEFLSVIVTVFFSESSTNTPNTGEYEDVFDTFNVLFVHDTFEELTEGDNN